MKPIRIIFSRHLQCTLALVVVALACACADPTEPEVDPRSVLLSVYQAMGGPEWKHSDYWTTDAPLDMWYGVTTDGQEHVIELDLSENGLVGSIPPELGQLKSLEVLDLWENSLTGSIPPELGNLENLRGLSLSNNELSGPIPPELGQLGNLEEYLYLWDNELSGSIPPELGNLANLRSLSLGDNQLSGPIPPELGNLANLTRLYLGDNQLSGPIPPELGNLGTLEGLYLWDNELVGSIPPELGQLKSLEVLDLWENSLTGPIPPELGNLANLTRLYLGDNQLSGPIPPELGNLSRVTVLALDGNALGGLLPERLADLTSLSFLFLDRNNLAGPIPAEFGRMASLRQLALSHNGEMAEPLPSELTSLRQLDALLAGGTNLCAPLDPDFQTWLEGVYKRRVAPCGDGEPPMAYLTQAVQSQEFPVPLVAEEKALLRVFVTARKATSEGIPPVRARFYVDGRETHVEEIPGKSTPIPTEVDESSLSKSANAEIPAEAIEPGLEMVIEVDPEGTLDEDLLVTRRIPETGRLALDVWAHARLRPDAGSRSSGARPTIRRSSTSSRPWPRTPMTTRCSGTRAPCCRSAIWRSLPTNRC